MEPLLSRLIVHSTRRLTTPPSPTPPWICISCRARDIHSSHRRPFFSTPARLATSPQHERQNPNLASPIEASAHAQPAADVSHNVSEAERAHFRQEEEHSRKQVRAPWHRDGHADAPVTAGSEPGTERDGENQAKTRKGKLLTTPSRMLKLILPLEMSGSKKEDAGGEDGNEGGRVRRQSPLALLVHPQQPLSYLERLIQSELPMVEDRGRIRAPDVIFRAPDSMEEDLEDETEMDDAPPPPPPRKEATRTTSETPSNTQDKDSETKHNSDSQDLPTPTPLQVEDPSHPNFVRWSPSTEIGDFIRDASHAREFAIDYESPSLPHQYTLYVAVPSFNERTFYLRARLRKTAGRIVALAGLKRECDDLAQKGAKRVAQAGFAGLLGWWMAVYWLTFRTDLGWEAVEPITYLVGLSGLMGGYMWFLYHNREASYRSAMQVTISRRRMALYEKRGFQVELWEGLVEEGNRLRREIKLIADEYDVEWNEAEDEGHEIVEEALRKARKKEKGESKKGGKKGGKDEDEEDEED